MSWDWTIFLVGTIVFLMLTKDTNADALTVSLCAAIVLLSIVVLPATRALSLLNMRWQVSVRGWRDDLRRFTNCHSYWACLPAWLAVPLGMILLFRRCVPVASILRS